MISTEDNFAYAHDALFFNRSRRIKRLADWVTDQINASRPSNWWNADIYRDKLLGQFVKDGRTGYADALQKLGEDLMSYGHRSDAHEALRSMELSIMNEEEGGARRPAMARRGLKRHAPAPGARAA